MRVPIAHAEGRFLFNSDLEDEILKNNLITYKYCDSSGNLSNDFPINPNGSLHSTAALSNPNGNIMAIMPHPERTLGNEADDLFKSMKNYMESDDPFSFKSLNFSSKKINIKKFKKPAKQNEILVSTIIADNEAASVEKCINSLGVKAKIKKYLHFEIDATDRLDINTIVSTDVLFNPSKEYIANIKEESDIYRFLVRSKDDIVGQSLAQTLQDRFNLSGLKSIKKGVVWEVKINSSRAKKDVDIILNSHIFSNPISQECHEY